MAESVGRKLQQARLARKLEIEDVAELTKIRPDRIIDLEAGGYSPFSNLTYAKNFSGQVRRVPRAGYPGRAGSVSDLLRNLNGGLSVFEFVANPKPGASALGAK